MPPRHIPENQAQDLARWERFVQAQGGCYPAHIAAIKLRMSPQGVYQAAQRGWITFFQVGRNRWYGRRDVIEYRWKASRKFRDNRPLPFKGPKKFTT